MITAVDSSVLIDVFHADAAQGGSSRNALQRASVEGSMIACEVVWAEVAALFKTTASMREAMDTLGIVFSPMSSDAAIVAGEAWRVYRRRGGGRARMVADFLIGAHAVRQADRLLTRDRGFYRSYFRGLKVLDPLG